MSCPAQSSHASRTWRLHTNQARRGAHWPRSDRARAASHRTGPGRSVLPRGNSAAPCRTSAIRSVSHSTTHPYRPSDMTDSGRFRRKPMPLRGRAVSRIAPFLRFIDGRVATTSVNYRTEDVHVVLSGPTNKQCTPSKLNMKKR